MRFAKGTLLGFGALAVVALLLNLVAPKAVHAGVATLVNIVNTTAAPGIVLDASKSASQHVELLCAATLGRKVG